MSDDLKNRGPADRARINVHEDHEVRYWTQELGVSREQLVQAVQAVGVMAADVRKHLGK
jgi:GTP cyclohydrolase III